jgi:hypothetical protein
MRADSFEGLPEPDSRRTPSKSKNRWPRDEKCLQYFAVGMEDVTRNFQAHDTFDERFIS